MGAAVTITIVGADKTLGEKLTGATIGTDQPYKYAHSKLLLARLRAAKRDVESLPEADQVGIMRNTLIVERNIAAFAAEQYAELNHVDIFKDLTEIVEEIDNLLKQS